jgi:hypothetical protein
VDENHWFDCPAPWRIPLSERSEPLWQSLGPQTEDNPLLPTLLLLPLSGRQSIAFQLNLYSIDGI